MMMLRMSKVVNHNPKYPECSVKYIKRQTCCTTYEISGRMNVRYCKASARLRYNVGSRKRITMRYKLGICVNESLTRITRDENPIRTLGDYFRPSHEGYRNTIELPDGNNVVPLRSDTIRLVQNGCSFHGLRSEDPNQHLKDFLKLVDSLDLDVANRERTRLHLFQFFLCDQSSNWLERLPTGSISTWEDLTTRFLAQFFPLGRTPKLRNDILMFQQHQGESLSEA
ncbi:zinc finger, CCHC-type containing protein [Tanacetum coccineum]